MARRSQRLRIVLTLAEREEQAVGVKLDRARQQLSRERRQLAQLREYNRDYTARIDCQRRGLRGDDLINNRHFLQQLHRAEEEQQNAVQRREGQLESLKRAWQEKYQRKKAVADWLERLRGAEDLELDKREQRLLDELVARVVGRSN